MSVKVTVRTIAKKHADGERLVCVTAYDVLSGSLAEAAGVDVVLVGDSLGNVILGHETTHGVELEDVVYHTHAVANGVKTALLVADMPFGSYQSSVPSAVDAAVELVRAGAEAVKLEGTYTDEIAAIVRAGIPVMGHVGMTPQSVLAFGGHVVQGRGNDGDTILAAARRIYEAGAFAIVLELVPAVLAARITKELSIPTIGIGAGPECSGEIQVFHDVLGLSETVYRHTRAFVAGRGLLEAGLREYVQSVRDRKFPAEENSS
ncbi:MAG: 3-methyl-2-oxobutanoate hydroxymethyltransferase [Fimbriimonadaceae bacterium]